MNAILDLLIASRWVHFAAMSVLFGSSLWSLVERAIADRTSILVRVASLAAIASGLGWLVCSLASMTGDIQSVLEPDTIWLFFFETPFGPVLIVRIALLSILLLLAFAPIPNRSRLAAIPFVAALLLVSQGWLGHAVQDGAGLFESMMLVVYAVHVLAAGAWAGALPALIVSVATRSDHKEIFDLLKRYSAIATVAVAAIALTGTANTLVHTGASLAALVSSGYGIVLCIKLGLVAAMLVCAAWNRFVAMPRLRDREAGSRDLSVLRVVLALELLLGTLVLGVAAVLGITPPPA